MKLVYPISTEFFPNLGPIPPISPYSSALISLLFRPSRVYFCTVWDFLSGSHCLEYTIDDIDVERLKHHIEVEDLKFGHPTGIDFHITFDWFCLGLRSSPLKDVRLHLGHINHSIWYMHSYSQIAIRPLTYVSDFAYTHLSYYWA